MPAGSSARGQVHESSDVDLLIIEDAPFGEGRSRYRETSRINRALAGFGVAKDILVYSIDEVERWHNTLNHVVSHALRDGRVLYDQEDRAVILLKHQTCCPSHSLSNEHLKGDFGRNADPIYV